MRANNPMAARRSRRFQGGVMLLEALIAILIFSVGILGIVGLQATAVKQSTEARYRSEASHLAGQLLGRMWIDNRTPAALQTKYNTCPTVACAGYFEWATRVSDTLPGATITSATLKPTVEVEDDGLVTIKIYWRSPSEDSSERHRYEVQSKIAQ
ncbi:hypothetical protein GCM10028796_54250 [Ramlibacter monticola]|uniref:Type IV pilus modification protein PilV n=1 Tax=Ramlibacter monticola TaxID=1926872 RepID=A0A936Z629_9BURK|nr:type IV pilus modification protein PilV [Ramlibacter monticola]